ncbi:hypothetical protein F4775DRAFT_544831 [Biscogniauxia sp. FL1348]|nr:hypothetical protein F4775DRAFT_544831 [Biscogniauxia sp. FL1348]
MAYRSTRSDFTVSERDYAAPRRPPPRGYDDVDVFDRHSPAPRRTPVPVREYEDAELDRTPAFLRDDGRRSEAGPLVLRSREVETLDRRRRSPSPGFRYRDSRLLSREPSMERRSSRFVDRSPSPPSVRVESRLVERRRERSQSPEKERDHIRLRIEREREKERVPSPSPSPPPPAPAPQVIRGPTIEREVITHYRDIDHGIERAKQPSPPPPPRRAPSRARERETDIDIYTSRTETDIDVRSRTRSRSRPAVRPRILQRPSSFDEEDVIIHRNRNELRITDSRRRSHSAAPVPDYEDEAEYITSKIDSRGQMGEAWHGATKDWTIVDVPPGTERVKMDGIGGGSAEVTWQRYNGVRRARFVPDREGTVVSSSPTTVSEPVRGRERERESSRERERLSVSIYDGREKSRDRDVEFEERDRRISIREGDRVPTRRRNDMWTEITKDLVVREAIERLGYEYEETEWFFYVMQYLRYEDVVELVNVSDDIRRARRHRARELEWERDYRDGWADRHRRSRKSAGWDKIDDERITEREVLYDRYYR